MASQPRVVVVLPATSYRADAYVRAAEELGVDLVLATDVPELAGRLGRAVVGADLTDPEAAAEAIVRDTGAAVAGVLGTDENTAFVAALAARRLGLRSHDPQGVRAVRHKAHMRERLAAGGVAGPIVRRVGPDEPPHRIGDVPFPCVVKPPMLSGSQGVIRADSNDELAEAIARARRILDRHPSPARDEPAFFELLVEEYIDGFEVAVEAIVRDGRLEPLAIFDKPDPLEGPFFEETIYVAPSRLPEATRRDVLAMTERAARALGLEHGPIHAELRVGPRGARIVEVAARSIGGLCSRTFEEMLGGLEQRLLAHAAGLDCPGRSVQAPAAAGVMMIPIPKSGVLRGVCGVPAAQAVAGVEDVTISARSGQAVRALPEGSSYLGFIFARGEEPAEVEGALRAAHERLEIDLAPLLN